MVEMCADHGYEAVTVRALSRLAGISTGTFYKHFPNLEECFASTYESVAKCALRRAYTAQRETSGGEEGVRAALLSLLADVANHPNEARLALVEAHAVGPAIRMAMGRATSALEQILSDRVPRTSFGAAAVARGIAAGVTRTMTNSLLEGSANGIPDLQKDLTDWIMLMSSQAIVGLEEPRRDSNRAPSQVDGVSKDAISSLPDLAGDDRSRILTAVVRFSIAGGFEGLTLARIRARAGVSRRAFHAQFANVEESFLEAIEVVARSTTSRAANAAAMAGRGDRPELDRVVEALTVEIARNPALARLVFVEIAAPGREGFYRRERLVSLAAAQVRARLGPATVPEIDLIDASVAAAWRISQTEVEAGRAHELPRLASLVAGILPLASGTHIGGRTHPRARASAD